MQNFSLLKQEFHKKWIEGLQICNPTGKKMGIIERKNTIKLSADLAMAFARRGTTHWSRAVIAKANNSNNQRLFFRTKKIIKRSRIKSRSRAYYNSSSIKLSLASSTAKKLVRKRTQVLRRLLPGGDKCLDEACLIREALDYILSLKAQADVMRSCLDRACKVVNGG